MLCIGDLMVDEFVYGAVSLISPEAPAPVLAVTRSELVIGGGGNVARNLASLAAEQLIEPHLVVDASRPTARKVRFVSEVDQA